MLIFVTYKFPAYHKWDKAPEEVSFLRNLHRHLFYVKFCISVHHDDREIEFFILKKKLEDFLLEYLYNRNNIVGSCEMIANDIISFFETLYPDRNYVCEISEDGENGAIVERNRSGR